MRGSVSPTGKSAILKGCVIFLSDALRESIAETHSTFTISPSKARGVVILSE
jgi:hypothetical protein